MVVPWDLIGTALVAGLAAAWWAGRRAAAAGVARAAPVDLAVTLGLAAIVGARSVAVLLDYALSGVLPGTRGLLTLGAGLSTPGGVAGALVAGWWVTRRGRVEAAVWRAVVPAVAAGLALWSLLALVRGDAAGVAAPPPFGWPLPGEAVPRVPVALLEALGYAAFALLAARGGRLTALPPPRLAAALAAGVAALHLVGSVLRPAAPTVDSDLDVLLGLLVLVAAGVLALGSSARVRRAASVGTALVAAALVGVATFAGGGPDGLEPATSGERSASDPGGRAPGLEHAVTAEGPPADTPPAWGPEELAAFTETVDGPVVVNFWGSWCPPCHAEAPALARVARAYGDDVTFLGVLVNDDPGRAAEFARRYALPFPSVDDGGLRGPLRAVGVPTTVVLHADGSVAARVVGGLDARGLAAAIDRADG